MCKKNKYSYGKGPLMETSVVILRLNRKVSIKLLNPSNEVVVIPKVRTIVVAIIIVPFSDGIQKVL